MPRLNNQDETVVEVYELTVTWDDPGDDPPVDLCDICGCSWLGTELFIDHPDYRDREYHCFECREVLGEEDNWFYV